MRYFNFAFQENSPSQVAGDSESFKVNFFQYFVEKPCKLVTG